MTPPSRTGSHMPRDGHANEHNRELDLHAPPSLEKPTPVAGPALIRVRPRPLTTHISRGRSVIATTHDGRIDGDPDRGLFVHETRLLSRWEYFIDDRDPSPNAFSEVRQNHWVGYFVTAAPGVKPPPRDEGSGQVPAASQSTLELQVTRLIDDGLHEDLDLTNYTTETASFVFAIALDADFADQGETRERQQFGETTVRWDRDAQRLTFEELKKRFNEAFWMEDEGFYALALDAQKRQVRSIASNAGHCIAAAIADASLVERTVDRLFAPDLFSGWGIRTLSSEHPRYNPYSYHLGSIWPVEHGTFALGFMRYGLHDRVQQIARAQFEAAALFEYHRLPELFGGHPRDERHPFPAIYPNACSPQAWSASSVFSLLQSLLGLYPYAPLKLLIVDPHLPEWLPEITLRDLRVGKACITIHFRRRADGRTSYRIVDQRGKLHVVRQATPWSLTTQPAERLRDALSSLLPRH